MNTMDKEKEIINLNGTSYILEFRHNEEVEALKKKLEPVDKKKVNRFPEKQTLELIKYLSKLFPLQSESVNEEYLIENNLTLLDASNVCGVIGKTEEAKRLLALFFWFENKGKNTELDYKAKEGEIAKSKYSNEYTTKIIQILKITDDAISITIKSDYPMTIENKDFKFILAPRITNEEDEK